MNINRALSTIIAVRNVIFLPGIIAPAAIRYARLVACLADVDAVTKDLEVYATETPPLGYSIAMEVAGVDRAADAARFDRFHLYGHSGWRRRGPRVRRSAP